jgi:hypothetical protein
MSAEVLRLFVFARHAESTANQALVRVQIGRAQGQGAAAAAGFSRRPQPVVRRCMNRSPAVFCGVSPWVWCS